MAWRKYFKIADTNGQMSPISGGNYRGTAYDPGRDANTVSNEFAFRNYQSRLPEVYTGHPNRIERYNQYENMDQDSEINACLDILAEFSTQFNEQNNTPFKVRFYEKPTDHEVDIIKKQLQQWVKLNEFDKRMFKIFRNCIKYSDQIFVRDPETFQLYWVDMTKLIKVIVNESKGKEPEQYCIRDINPNFTNLSVAVKSSTDFAINPPAAAYTAPNNYTAPNQSGGGSGSRFTHAMNETVIDAKHVMHLSLSEGLDLYWPFGQSVLENIFKVYKQKELLEDAILIYRVQRAPERRVFKIDVGNMPSHLAMQFVERVKNEIHQRRIPSTDGGTANIMDSSYNPLSINEDYFFPTTAEGRGSTVDVLPGGQNLGEIDDLRYFNNKMMRGLRVPSSYLPTGPDDSDRSLADGRVGTALIQEFRFNQYCERLQKLMSHKLDDEFKMFLNWRGFNIDSSLFDIEFNEPQNFASYRQTELDSSRIQAFTQLEQLPYLSKRFMLKRYLGLTEEEIVENEEMWDEERGEADLKTTQGQDMRSVGISPGDIQSDMDTAGEMEGTDINEPLGNPAAPEAGAPNGIANPPVGPGGA